MRQHSALGRTAGAAILALMLAGCAGSGFSFGGGSPPAPQMIMAGRWMLSAPNAPACGMNFSGAADAREGKVAPEGGCPGKFYLSRTWTLDRSALTVIDDENRPLGQFEFANGRFDGRSADETPLTLTR